MQRSALETVISQEISKGRQSIDAERILALETGERKIKVRLKIKSDSYDFQSYARADVFNPESLSWNPLASIPYSNMKTKTGLVYQPGQVGWEAFETDLQTLLVQTRAILLD
jgi:hypothetical protein